MKIEDPLYGMIDWEEGEVIEHHGDGCVLRQMHGENEEGVEYFGTGNFCHGELFEVTDVEEI